MNFVAYNCGKIVMLKKVLSFLIAVCILVSPLTFGVQYTDNFDTAFMTSDAASVAPNYRVFRQIDQVWGQYDPSGGAGCTIYKNGCGLISIVNAVYYLNGNIINVKALFDWAYSTGGYGTSGTYRNTIYPKLTSTMGSVYGFSVGTMKYGKVTDSAFISHLQNGGTAIVHVANHFMCIADYDAASGRYLLLDCGTTWGNRHSSVGGNWMTANELQGGITSNLNVDWWCLFSAASASCTNYTLTAKAGSGKGSVFFFDDVSTAKFAGGDCVFFRPVPASGYKVSSITLNGTSIAVQNNGNPAMYQLTMPKANAELVVNFTTGGTTNSNNMIVSSASYTLPASLGSRGDCAEPNTYVGWFPAGTTSFTKATAITYYSATAYFYENNKSAIGYTMEMQAGYRGGNYTKYNTTGTFIEVIFDNSTGKAVSNTVNVTVSGSDPFADTLTYIPSGKNGNISDDGTSSGGGNTGGGTTTYNLKPTDIIFDVPDAGAWISAGAVSSTSLAFETTSKGDTALKMTASASSDPFVTLNYSLLDVFSASTYKYMIVTAMTTSSNKNAKMYLSAGSLQGASESCAKGWQWNNDGLWHDYVIDLSSLSNWTGNVNQIRFDYFDGETAANSVLYLRSVRFLSSAPSNPTVTTSYSTFAVGSDIVVSYSGIESYLGTKQNADVYVGIYPQGVKPGENASLLWAATSSVSGTVNVTQNALGGSKYGQTLSKGDYTAWISYDGKGTTESYNINNVMFASSSSSCDFSIADTASSKYPSLKTDDIIFDMPDAGAWISEGSVNQSALAFETTSKGDTALKLTANATATNDAYVTLKYSLLDTISADDYKYMIITAMTTSSNTDAKMYFSAGSLQGASESCAKGWQWNNDGLWHDYVIDLTSLSNWTGNVNQLRFDYFNGTVATGTALYLRSVRFVKSAPSKPTVTTETPSFVVGSDIVLNYSGLDSYLDTKQNADVYVGIYNKGEKPGSVASLQWAATTSTNGTVNVTQNALGGSMFGAELPVGEYTAWITYDAMGTTSSYNLNNVMFDSASASYDFAITENLYSLNATVSGGSGSAHFGNNVTSLNVEAGWTVNVQVTPSTGYKVSSIKINGTAQTIKNNGGEYVYTFTMPAQNTTVAVTFTKIQYAVSVGTVSNGTVTLSKTGNVDYGTTITVTATPATGYKLNQILVNGTVISGTTFTVTAASTVTATFTQNLYSLNATVSGGSGVVHFGDNVTSGNLAYGSTVNYQVTPSTGYKVSKILVNGTEQTIKNNGGEYVYTFTMPAQNTTVAVTFTKIQYAVSVGTVSNGTVTLSKTGNVDYGTTITVTATPATGYKLNQILVNGTAISGTTFTVTAASTVTAAFKPVISDTDYDFVVGGSTGSTVISATVGHTIDVALNNLVALGGSDSVTIKKADGEVAVNTDLIATGMIAEIDGKDYTIVVFGDVDCDGKVTVADAQTAYACLKGTAELSAASKDAAKMAKSGAVSIIDVMAVLNMI